MSKLTYKVKHTIPNINDLLEKARQIAEIAITTRTKTTKDVKHIGLKAAFANAILRKYGNNRKTKKISNVKLAINGYHIKIKDGNIWIPALKVLLPFNKTVVKVCQIELDSKFAYVCCEVEDEMPFEPKGFIGVDLNATGHIAVCALNNKIVKMGKKAPHIHKKYKSMRARLQRKNKHAELLTIANREQRICLDIDHKISRKIVNLAKEHNYGIKLEKLTNIRKNTKKQSKKLNHVKSSWSFYRLQSFVAYKAKLLGVPVVFIDPHFTSQTCSKCGLLGDREKKTFKCPHCGHAEHADANAAFNIAVASDMLGCAKKEICTRGNTDLPPQEPIVLQPME